MSTDNVIDYSDSVYDELMKEAEIDNRVGKGPAIITKITRDLWPSGDPRTKINFSLLFAGNAKADMTFSDPPPPDVIKAEKATWETKKKKGVAAAVSLIRQLGQHYGKTFDDLQEGDQFEVETVKTRREKDGSGGFIRVIAFLPPQGAASAAPSGGPKF